jgi:hypothetical protein
LLLGVAISLAAACGDDASESEARSCEQCTLAIQLDRLKAGDAVDCGSALSEYFDAEYLADASVANQNAYDCLSAALDEAEPFVFVLELQGIDSHVEVGWVMDDEGVVHQLDYDSDICGGAGCMPGCGPSVTRRVCENPSVAGPNQRVRCEDTDEQTSVCAPDRGGARQVSGD